MGAHEAGLRNAKHRAWASYCEGTAASAVPEGVTGLVAE